MQAEAGKMPEERHPGLGSRLGASKEPIGVETPIDPWTSYNPGEVAFRGFA